MKKWGNSFGWQMIIFVMVILSSCKNNEDAYTKISDLDLPEQAYMGAKSCKDCHSEEYTEWKKSDHFRAMEQANDSTVLGDFSDIIYKSDGIQTRFYKKNGDFFINTEGADGEYHDYKIEYTFGYYPLQQYLIKGEGGRLQVTRQSWDSRENKWFHQYQGQHIPHDDWLHWTGNAQSWNMMCATCHSTNLQKKYNPDTDTYQTTHSLLTVSCEACHGPGKQHISLMQSEDYKSDLKGKYPKTLTDISTQKAELSTCFPCHARRGELGNPHINSDEILDNYLPEIPSTPLYFADGQVLDENYKYSSFLQSKMYQQGVRCSDCHNSHTSKLKLPGYQVCLQCHASPVYDTSKHTFHEKGTEGASCISCHMPTRTYMGNDVRHDHIFRPPRPDLTVKYGVPNTCNQCHADKSAKWASQAIEKWYGKERAPHFAEDLIIGSLQNEKSEASLLRLLNDSIPDIIQATAVHYLGDIPTEKSLNALTEQTRHKEAQVRYQAVRALSKFPLNYYQSEIIVCLQDEVRAVRVAAADALLTDLGLQGARQLSPHFEKARKELEAFLRNQSDFAQGSAALADYYTKIGNTNQAITFYKRALQKDHQLNYVRLNLAGLYNQLGKNELAVQILKEAIATFPNDSDAYYRLGLLFYELNDTDKSLKNLRKAVGLKSDNPRLYYNYGLILQQNKEYESAEEIFLKGLQVSPNNKEIEYALYTLYNQNGQHEKAEKYGR